MAGTRVPRATRLAAAKRAGKEAVAGKVTFCLVVFSWPFIERLSQTRLALNRQLLCYLLYALGICQQLF